MLMRLPGPNGVFLIVFGCILYPSTQSKSGKLSAPHFGPPALTENSNSHSDHSPTNKTEEGPAEAPVSIHSRVIGGNCIGHGAMDYRKEARATRKVIGGNQRSQTGIKSRVDSRNRHCCTIHHRIAGVSEGVQYGVLNIPHDAKMADVIFARISKIICLSRGTLEHPQTAF
ncbi:hypothetical protein CRG98_010718 [Punica granatum]|uniref:Secreted protein n=1 Tax=Punica granatum TaxID=22663 RepID=A0A2I0KKZ4_PUNGR|nr:hypothetical protein CRG98_010718 [Punica granatum]